MTKMKASEWIIKSVWIIAIGVILALSIWVVVLSNQKIKADIKNDAFKIKMELLEQYQVKLENENSILLDKLIASDDRLDTLINRYVQILNDDEYKAKNTVNFIHSNAEWNEIIGTIGPVSEGRTDLQNRFLDVKR